jgi:hypothetical protein
VRWFLANPMAHLLTFAVVLTGGLCVYLFAGLSASASFQTLAGVGWAVMLVLWVVADARRRRAVPCYDFGLLVGVTFPVSVAWYCVWSRGWRGFLWAGGLILLWLAPYVVAGIVWGMLYGRA